MAVLTPFGLAWNVAVAPPNGNKADLRLRYRVSREERRVHDRSVEGERLADKSLVDQAALDAESHAGRLRSRCRSEASGKLQHARGGWSTVHDG